MTPDYLIYLLLAVLVLVLLIQWNFAKTIKQKYSNENEINVKCAERVGNLENRLLRMITNHTGQIAKLEGEIVGMGKGILATKLKRKRR